METFISLQMGNVDCQATLVERLKCGFCKKSFIINDFLQNPHFSRRTKFPSHRHTTVCTRKPKKQMVSVFKVGQGLPMIVSLWMAKHFVEKRVTWPGNNRD